MSGSCMNVFRIGCYAFSTIAYVTKGGGAQVTYRDQCGDISAVNGVTIYSLCGGRFVVVPNPASSTLTVSLTPSMVANASTNTIMQINIYDNLGKPVKTNVFKLGYSGNIGSQQFNARYLCDEIRDESGNKERQKLQILK